MAAVTETISPSPPLVAIVRFHGLIAEGAAAGTAAIMGSKASTPIWAGTTGGCASASAIPKIGSRRPDTCSMISPRPTRNGSGNS